MPVQNWLSERLQTVNLQLQIIKPKTALIDGVISQVEQIQLDLIDQSSVSSADFIGSMEQIQPIMATLKTNNSVEGQAAYSIFLHTFYKRSETKN